MQRANPVRFVAAIWRRLFDDSIESAAGSIDFFRLDVEIGRTTVNVQSYIELTGLDLLLDVACDPRLLRIDKNNGKRLVYSFVPVDEFASGGSGFATENVQTKQTARATMALY